MCRLRLIEVNQCVVDPYYPYSTSEEKLMENQYLINSVCRQARRIECGPKTWAFFEGYCLEKNINCNSLIVYENTFLYKHTFV